MRTILTILLAMAATDTVVVRPVEIHDVLVNPGMGIQTFQRFNGDAINPGTRWSEVGPEAKAKPAAAKPDFPDSSVAYIRWFWSQFEPEPGKYRWDILDIALESAREHHQKLMIRIMPYDQDHPLPEWYQQSGARRINKATDKDGKIWQPDADDPTYAKTWGALVAAAGARYDGHPYLDSVDISTAGYWGEGWGPYLPSWQVQKQLIDQYFDAFHRTPLVMNFDALEALRYGAQRGAGWRLDCWGDLGGRGKGFAHMFDLYPQQVVRAGVQDVWQKSPVSLETCGTPAGWKTEWHYTADQVDYSIEQALRWHASTINIKSTAIPPEWKGKFDEFQKKLGYRFVLRKLEYPAVGAPRGDDAGQHVVVERRRGAGVRRLRARDPAAKRDRGRGDPNGGKCSKVAARGRDLRRYRCRAGHTRTGRIPVRRCLARRPHARAGHPVGDRRPPGGWLVRDGENSRRVTRYADRDAELCSRTRRRHRSPDDR